MLTAQCYIWGRPQDVGDEMKLDHYLHVSGLSVPDFAAQIDRTPQTVWRWLNGTRAPKHEEMRLVHRATLGAVTPNDWVLPE